VEINFILFSVLAYLIGSIPSAFFIGKMHGLDIRELGSRSTTSTILSRALGWRWALVSGICDALKAMLVIIWAMNYFSMGYKLVFISLMPLAGNTLPFYLKFRGGKGGAAFFGSVIALAGWKFFFTRILIFLLILVIFKRSSIANLSFVWIMSVLLYLSLGYYYGIFGLGAALLITFALRENIKRLKEGAEPQTSLKW